MRSLLALLVPLAVLFTAVSGFHGIHSRRTREPVEIIPKSRRAVLEQWIEQRLDHFNPRDNRTWQMRYMSNDEHFKPGGHIMIHIGGEWEITPAYLQGGQSYDIAKQHNAYMLYTEHRYYGKSYPTPDASTENLQYLHADQALADLAYFVQYVKETIPGLSESKVLVVGGSYAGNLAVWFRVKYPHLVDAALASSAPLLAVADFYKYYEVVGTALKTLGGAECYNVVETAMQQLRQELQTVNGQDNVNKWFNLCTPVDLKLPLNFGIFVQTIQEMFASEVQYNDPAWQNVVSLCRKLVEGSAKNTELFALAQEYKKSYNAKCNEVDYQKLVKQFQETVWGSTSAYGPMRQWYYQTCTEYGYYQTDTSENQPFGQGDNTLDLAIQLCKDIYGDVFSSEAEKILNTSVERTNVIYGALKPDVTKVLFTHGTVDPWHVLGVLEDLNEQAPAIVIQGASHCKDLQSLDFYDSQAMRAAKIRVQEIISEWLKE